MDYKYKFTVFTPTYNRANQLPNVYECLKKQTFSDFEWLIVDDGSMDNTEEVVHKWIEEKILPIRYFKKNNGGKHTAYNYGVQRANGELFLSIDSDDTCVFNAIEILNDTWESIDNKEEFSAVTGNCFNEKNEVIGTTFPKDIFDSNSIDMRFKHNIKGDKFGFQKTDVLKRYPIPEPEGIKLAAETVTWRKIALTHKTRFINKNLLLYTLSEDSLTNQSPLNFAPTRILDTLDLFENYLNYFWDNPLLFIKSGIQYVRSCIHTKKPIFKFKNNLATFLILIITPVGICFYIMDKLRGF